jgi:hypothetical protein
MAGQENEGIEARLARLVSFDRAALIEVWTACYGRLPPPKASQRMMIKAIAYRWQEEALGGLPSRSKSLLRKIACGARNGGRNPLPSLAPAAPVKAGTRFVREWHGRLVDVAVDDAGRFLWDGRSFASLSAIAREVTGTRRNGPAFFGLRES